ncbi:MAG: DEAD/DEAH box helicase [Kineothrix sp.]
MDKLYFQFTEDSFTVDGDEAISPGAQRWKEEFEKEKFSALYNMGFKERPDCLDAGGNYLYLLASRFACLLSQHPDLELARENTVAEPTAEEYGQLLDSIPFLLGAEYVTEKWIRRIFGRLQEVFAREISQYKGKVSMYLAEKSQYLRVPERIFFHLVESGKEDFPFAFLATYATREKDGRIRHVPLQYALTEYKGRREKLLELLSCLNRAAEVSGLIGEFVERGELFHPLRLSSQEAYEILKAVPALEEAGIMCRIPNWWRRRSGAVSVTVNLGEEKPALLGLDTLLQMRPELTLDGMPLTREEVKRLLAQTEGLALLKGRWVEVSHERLQRLLEEIDSYRGEITLMEALRMGLKVQEGREGADVGPVLTNGKWLASLLQNLRVPANIRSAVLPKSLRACLRPYQKTGYTWLNYMDQMGFGACLADDMGLGKTLQVIAFLEKLRGRRKKARILLVVPASLLGNWQREAEKFAPEMELRLLHGRSAAVLGQELKAAPAFLTITTYGMAARIKELEEIRWDCLILDEAQAIKNPVTRQTKQIKRLKSRMRIAMTGTPIENNLTNLWSLFDFLNKGLLGSSAEFKEYCKGLEEHPEGYARLKAMIAPFMLRRVKTDKEIISDLPDKLEQVDYVSLSKKQAVLYRKLVAEAQERLKELNGIERRGMVLSLISRLKQVCNHPDQYLGQQTYAPEESGKFRMLRDICETICEKRERVLVFTQFKEISGYLDEYLFTIFGRRGFVLHGGVPVPERNRMVEAFQGEKYIPYMVLSVKAGGTGLNLTKASHVIHFDRWWNPAVENQATDRAYRIGQKNNVLVHKLVCKGSVEEKIDEMINSKKELAENVIGSGGESWLTEMSNEELLSVLRLDEAWKGVG